MEQLAIWGSVDVWQSAHVKKIRLPVVEEYPVG
jgi:hypothetical protein